MPKIHSCQDIEALGGDDWLTPAERQLIAACAAGEECILGDGTLPPEGDPSPERELRAEVLRYLILGGCDANPVRGWGVMVKGAHATGELDFSFALTKGLVSLVSCRFQSSISAIQSRIEALHLAGSVLRGLNAHGAKIEGHLFLRDTEIIGEVFLSEANVNGQFDCAGARFHPNNAVALNAHGLRAGSDVILRHIVATGEVSLTDAKIAGQLACRGARFQPNDGRALHASGIQVGGNLSLRQIVSRGEITLIGATVSGQLLCNGAQIETQGDEALNAQRLSVLGGLFWREVKIKSGRLSFASAHISDLADDPESWPGGRRLILAGFTYDRISASFTDAERRIEWLEKGAFWRGEFFPQPFTHLANTLRAMGHDSDANMVLFRREQLIRRHIRLLSRVTPNGDVSTGFSSLWWDSVNAFRWLWDQMLRVVLGYGHYPFRCFFWLLGLIIAAAIMAQLTWSEGSFAPNSGPVLISEGWQEAARIRCVRGDPGYGTEACNPAALWSAQSAPGQDWETFQPLAYAADLVIPIVNFSQTGAWAPSTTRGPMGKVLWWARWFCTGAGWLITALVASMLAGAIRQE
ncbi:hypothetical protein M3P21_17425 [Ruegeria sp. 2012CJ41-6]|uniref:Membrane-associated oxidoreductase n=1 Tax=Ruegeria spongiae TaxID=2942209 RepID=A0ABT0Q823_9RHOB|nr:hypothetical protein [Ruegeria spongiae]MCL6285313.1 hypothetical protein [Ruegeria spongiae]